MKRLRRLLAALTLTAALATGYTLTTTPGDTTWGAPPTDPTPITLLDTTWG